MLSPLGDALDAPELLLEESWELTALHHEAAALAVNSEFWRDIEDEACALPLALPPPTELDCLLDWSADTLEAGAGWRAGPDADADPLLHHDCMWAGKCDDRLHPGNAPDALQSAPPGRSLLLVQRCRAPPPPQPPPPPPPPALPPRPDTPLSLDEEEPPQFRHQVDVARLLQPPRDAVAADHSYVARSLPHARDRFDNLGVQTPSDSEEEIDVETVGEKSFPGAAAALPTNPSLLERASLQRTVASAMGPRKRVRAASPAAVRKRARTGGRRGRASPAHRRRAPDSDSEPEGTDVERRSLHNDMERMRRIGLKNLFDELKAQVPSTRDKARAPKVAILREAALLCRRLQAEERERDALRRQQARLLARVRRLRLSAAPYLQARV